MLQFLLSTDTKVMSIYSHVCRSGNGFSELDRHLSISWKPKQFSQGYYCIKQFVLEVRKLPENLNLNRNWTQNFATEPCVDEKQNIPGGLRADRFIIWLTWFSSCVLPLGLTLCTLCHVLTIMVVAFLMSLCNISQRK